MCGIFGLSAKPSANVSSSYLQKIMKELFILSESRGKEAAGIAVRFPDEIDVLKQPVSATELIKSKVYKDIYAKIGNGKSIDKPISIVGHSRLVTNGMQSKNDNNQPVITNKAVGVHNGIIVNVDDIWKKHSDMKRLHDVDTEVILSLMEKYSSGGEDLAHALKDTFENIEGAASIAVFQNHSPYLIMATNTGSLYVCENSNNDMMIFASEYYILKTMIDNENVEAAIGKCSIRQVRPGEVIILDIESLQQYDFDFYKAVQDDFHDRQNPDIKINDLSSSGEYTGKTIEFIIQSPDRVAKLPRIDEGWVETVDNLRRCTKCVLPETMPFITFDDEGVCNYCHNYKKQELLGVEALEKVIEPFRSKAGKPDCIVAFSGGRDSSYGLHYLKKELGLNPISYTYDWGMVTDLARRNQARMCGKLGIEHILISADIKQKRENIRKNVEAWLKKPDLGIVPLFMAGDKQFFYYANQLKNNLELNLALFCACPLEKTNFKTGFCGIDESSVQVYYNISFFKKMRLAMYYMTRFLNNPSYLNSSLYDTFKAYLSTYMMSHDYVFLFDYIKWDENTINDTLINEYNWETSPDTKTTWRIGDGTAAFYNYIYYVMAGLTENDTFRSNQVREGDLTREEALEIVKIDNKPRYESLLWYADQIGFDAVRALDIINKAPKTYNRK